MAWVMLLVSYTQEEIEIDARCRRAKLQEFNGVNIESLPTVEKLQFPLLATPLLERHIILKSNILKKFGVLLFFLINSWARDYYVQTKPVKQVMIFKKILWGYVGGYNVLRLTLSIL